MAKISARGDKAQRTWDLPRGGKIVYTKQGRLLRKYVSGETYNLVGTKQSPEAAERYARAMQARYGVGLSQ